VTLDQLLHGATTEGTSTRSKKSEPAGELPPGLAELQQDLKLSSEDVEMLARINFRGNRPKDKEGWRFLLQAIKMSSQQNWMK
jgi:hypothetical protein